MRDRGCCGDRWLCPASGHSEMRCISATRNGRHARAFYGVQNLFSPCSRETTSHPTTSLRSAQYAPELSAAEVKAALEILDTNKDGQIQLGEFVDWWLKKIG